MDESDYSRTTDERSKKSNYLGKYRRYAFWTFGIISPLKCPLSVETANFYPTTLNFDIRNYFCTKDERSKKSNYLGKYCRYAFSVFRIILPLKYPLSVKKTDFAPTTRSFNIANYLCTKDKRSKRSYYLGKYRRGEFWIFEIISTPKYPLSAETINFALTTLNFDISNYSSCTTDERSKKSNYLGNYHRYAFRILGIILPPEGALSVETTNFASTTLDSDILYRFCTKDEQSKKLNDLGKFRRYALWIYGVILTPKCPLSVETTNFASTTLNFDISNYFCTKEEHSKKSNYLGKYRRCAFWIFGIISPPKWLLSVETINFVPITIHFEIPYYFFTKDERCKKSNFLGKHRRYAFWIFGIISPLECSLPVETTNFAPTTLNFDIPDYFCTKDERSEK